MPEDTSGLWPQPPSPENDRQFDEWLRQELRPLSSAALPDTPSKTTDLVERLLNKLTDRKD